MGQVVPVRDGVVPCDLQGSHACTGTNAELMKDDREDAGERRCLDRLDFFQRKTNALLAERTSNLLEGEELLI